MDPKHVGLILDGNRRFARKLMMKPWKGHEFGAKKIEDLMNWSREMGITQLTLYAFSIENFNRPKEEFDYLMQLFEKEFKKVLQRNVLHENKVRVRFLGRINLFPENVQTAMRDLEESTKHYTNYRINFCMAYGGRQEIVDATRKMFDAVARKELDASSINEDTFKNYLYMSDEPDMIIRTGGEKRSSNFLAWQGTYSEWFYIEKTWPEFTKEDYAACVTQFKQRERRFGR